MSRINVTINRKTTTASTLSNIYRAVRSVIEDEEAYYSKEQLERLMEDGNNVFVERKR